MPRTVIELEPDVLTGANWPDERFKFPLLADTEKTVAGLYSVTGLMGLPRRSVFVIDPKGTIKYLHRAVLGVTFRPVSELIEAVATA